MKLHSDALSEQLDTVKSTSLSRTLWFHQPRHPASTRQKQTARNIGMPLLFALAAMCPGISNTSAADTPDGKQDGPKQNPQSIWPSAPPDDCPFAKSERHGALIFTGRNKNHTQADTWYHSWASDNKLYSPFTDGSVNGVSSGSGYNFTRMDQPKTGFAVIEGSNPMDLRINPHFPALRSDPLALSGASRRKQIPCSDKYSGCFDARTQFARPADQISVDVGFEYVRDGNLLLAGEFEVAIHVRTWIEHRSDPCGIIAKQIGKPGDAGGLNAFKNEGHDLFRLV